MCFHPRSHMACLPRLRFGTWHGILQLPAWLQVTIPGSWQHGQGEHRGSNVLYIYQRFACHTLTQHADLCVLIYRTSSEGLKMTSHEVARPFLCCCCFAAHFCPGTNVQRWTHCVYHLADDVYLIKRFWKAFPVSLAVFFLHACLRRMKCGLGVGGNFVC